MSRHAPIRRVTKRVRPATKYDVGDWVEMQFGDGIWYGGVVLDAETSSLRPNVQNYTILFLHKLEQKKVTLVINHFIKCFIMFTAHRPNFIRNKWLWFIVHIFEII